MFYPVVLCMGWPRFEQVGSMQQGGRNQSRASWPHPLTLTTFYLTQRCDLGVRRNRLSTGIDSVTVTSKRGSRINIPLFIYTHYCC